MKLSHLRIALAVLAAIYIGKAMYRMVKYGEDKSSEKTTEMSIAIVEGVAMLIVLVLSFMIKCTEL